MKKRLAGRAFIYFLCVSFLLMMNGFPIGAEAKEKGIPIGEMVAKGEVKYEARENAWKEVESFHFPIFEGTKFKTEKGAAIITLSNNSQVEVGQSSLFSFDQNDRFILSKGNIEFRIPPSSEINFKAGNLSIMKSRALQAAKNPSVSPTKDEDTMGSISVHSNGSVTVKNIQGRLSILNQDRVVLAALSSKDSITIPSITTVAPSKVMVAQPAPPVSDPPRTENSEGFLGLSTGAWAGIGVGFFGTFGGATALSATSGKGGPTCF
jgi:hypothetical protein